MAQKVHIGKNGPAVCEAEKGNCPYGVDRHFNSMEEAEKVYAKELAEEHGSFSTIEPIWEDKEIWSDLSDQELEEFKHFRKVEEYSKKNPVYSLYKLEEDKWETGYQRTLEEAQILYDKENFRDFNKWKKLSKNLQEKLPTEEERVRVARKVLQGGEAETVRELLIEYDVKGLNPPHHKLEKLQKRESVRQRAAHRVLAESFRSNFEHKQSFYPDSFSENLRDLKKKELTGEITPMEAGRLEVYKSIEEYSELKKKEEEKTLSDYDFDRLSKFREEEERRVGE